MSRKLLSATAAALFTLPAWPTSAQPSLTLDRALVLARERAPAVLAARLQIEEARGHLSGARAWLAENPTLSGGLGRRLGVGPARPLEAQVELSQPVELGGRRAARIEAADAGVAAAAAGSEGTLRETEAQVARAFFRALFAAERARLAAATQETAAHSARALERRHQVGDVPILEVNLARTALARASAEVRGARALELAALGDLEVLLGLEPGASVAVSGRLEDQRRYDLPRLLERSGQRSDTRALLAEARAARAQASLARAERWPRLGLGGSFEREDGEDLVLGTLSLELPVFQRGQGLRAAAEARARRLAGQAEATRRAAEAAVRVAFEVHQQRLAAARALQEVLPLVADNEALASRSLEAGQLSLADWLVVRREALETRREYLERLLEAADAGVGLALAAGVSP